MTPDQQGVISGHISSQSQQVQWQFSALGLLPYQCHPLLLKPE